MTRTITHPTAARSDVPGLADAAVPTEPSRVPASAPRRRRSRFPGPGGPAPGSRPAVRWAGAEGVLRDLVRDHALAVGLDLIDRPDGAEPACIILDVAALRAENAPRHRGGAPLLVVTDSPTVPAEVWPAALAAGARAVLPLPGGSDELISRLAALARPRSSARLLSRCAALARHRSSALGLGVVGGCGGAGASSFAARLAAAARAQGPVTLIDADPLGGGADLLVEAPVRDGLRWQEATGLGP